MAQKFQDILTMIQNSQIRVALERMFAIIGVSGSDTASTFTIDGDITGDVTGDLTGDVTGDVTGNVTGDLTGNVVGNVTGNVVGNVTGDLTGKAKQINDGADPVNAIAAQGTLDVTGVVIDGETVTIDGVVYEFDTDGVVTGSNTQVDISGGATASQGTLTISGVAKDTETVVINSRTYEFDQHESSTITGDVRVDISETAGYSTRSEGELTLANGDLHGDTIVVAGTTTTLKADGTAGSATVIDMTVGGTYPNTLQRGTMTLTLANVPADGETFVINGRTYEFDTGDDGIGGDVEIDTSAATTIDEALTAIETDYNADGSRVANAVKDLVNNTITFTAITAGVASNYVCSETMAGGAISGNFTGGADILGTELGALVLAHYQVGGAGEESTVKAVAGATADKVIFRAFLAGTAGDAITTTHTLTAGSFDAVTLGTKEAGADCSAADAVTALVAAITGDSANIPVSAADGAGDTVVLTHDTPGTAGDSVTTTETMANGAFDAGTLGTTTAGVDCIAATAITALAALSPAATVTIVDGAGDTVVVTALTKGTAGNSIATTETMANGAFDAATLGTTTAGVDGTVGLVGEVRYSTSYLYLCTAANTVADANWARAAITTGF